MRYGFYLPTRGPLANRSDLSAILDTAEKLGFASTMVADHIILPTKIDSAYPYTVKGNFLSQGECFEQLAQREVAGNHRCAVRRPGDGWHRRWLDGGRI